MSTSIWIALALWASLPPAQLTAPHSKMPTGLADFDTLVALNKSAVPAPGAAAPTAAATLLAHAMRREGKASLFLPTNYIEGVHPDWFGGLRAKYSQPS